MNVAVCDDEKKTREQIVAMIKEQYSDAKISCFSTAEEMIAGRGFFDICFLDIEMGSVSGIELAKRIRKEQGNSGKRSIIIFVTAFREYMEDAFDVNAFHYLVKPINYSVSNSTWSYVERLINNDNQISVAKANAFVDGYLIILSVLNIAVYTSLFYVYLKFIEKKYVHRGYEPSLWENIFLIFPCITALCISVTLRLLIVKMEEGTATIAYDTMPVARFWIVVICIFLLVSIILTMMLFQYLIERNEDNRKQAILEKQVEQLHREIEDIEEIYTDLRGLKHDMRNHMNNIMQYVKSTGNENVREIDSYISQMEDVVDRLDFSAKSGNPITDIIIYQRQQEARKHDIIFDVEFVAPDTEQIDIYDIAVIMNNALENAFEACNELAGCREVSLRSYMKGALFFIEVENDFDGDITIDKETGLPMTSKKDKYLHGIGLYNLQKCARKYMGDVDIEIQSKDGRKRFLLTVMMNGKISLQK